MPKNDLIETLNPPIAIVVGAENHTIDRKTSEGNSRNRYGNKRKGVARAWLRE